MKCRLAPCLAREPNRLSLPFFQLFDHSSECNLPVAAFQQFPNQIPIHFVGHVVRHPSMLVHVWGGPEMFHLANVTLVHFVCGKGNGQCGSASNDAKRSFAGFEPRVAKLLYFRGFGVCPTNLPYFLQYFEIASLEDDGFMLHRFSPMLPSSGRGTWFAPRGRQARRG